MHATTRHKACNTRDCYWGPVALPLSSSTCACMYCLPSSIRPWRTIPYNWWHWRQHGLRQGRLRAECRRLGTYFSHRLAQATRCGHRDREYDGCLLNELFVSNQDH